MGPRVPGPRRDGTPVARQRAMRADAAVIVLRRALQVQGAYYLVTGVWPVVSMASFELVTGAKHDEWLVKTVGLLAAVIGANVLAGASSPAFSRRTLILSVSSALAFTAIDLIYGGARVISPVYFVDAGAQVSLLTLIIIGWRTLTG